MNAEPFLHVDFKDRGLLPLFDLYENDFICYQMQNDQFVVFNIIDFSEFDHSSSLMELLDKLGYKK